MVCEAAARAWLAENPKVAPFVSTLVPVQKIAGNPLNDASLAGLVNANAEGLELLEHVARAVRKAGLVEPTIGQVMRALGALKVKGAVA